MADEPATPGAIQVTVAVALPRVAVTLVGAPGTVVGVTDAEAAEAALAPAALVALSVKVYAVPFVKPVTMQDVAPVVEQVLAPLVEVTV